MKKTDGNTKKRVDEWNQNIKVFTEKNKKQIDLLDKIQLNEARGVGGGSAASRDYFSLIVVKMAKDIEDLVKNCQQVLTLNIKKAVTSQD